MKINKRVVVLGAHGQLGQSLQRLVLDKGFDSFRFFARADLDLSDVAAIGAFFDNLDSGFDVLINCAAYTDVEGAESQSDLSEKINHQAVEHLARAALAQSAIFIHISTDYVFGQGLAIPLKEADSCEPLNAYGRDKRAGELSVCNLGGRALIIRTSGLYSERGKKNFVKTILRLSRERDSLDVVYDEVSAPTYAGDLAHALLTILHSKALDSISKPEIFHYSNEGAVSRFDFSHAIIDLAKIECRLVPILSRQYPSKVERPAYSVFDTSRIRDTFSIRIPYWRDALARCLKKMNNQGD